jgi:TolB-like protein
MKQAACVLVFLILAGVPARADKMRVAVVDFHARGIPVSVAQNVSELVRNEMINTGLYTVIERSQMGEILKEQGIQQTGCTDLSCAVEIGKVLSANKIMLGTVMKMGSSIIITGRIVDVQSGMGEFSESQDAASESGLYAAVKLFTERLSARIQGKALESMPAQPLPAKGIEAVRAAVEAKA